MYQFKLAIGDWGYVGHEKCIYYIIQSNKPIDSVREAYFKASAMFGTQLDKYLCCDDSDAFIDEDKYDKLTNFGIPMVKIIGSKDDMYAIWVEEFVQIVLEFIMKGDPELILCVCEDKIPMFQFYGYDEQHRHIGALGYGLFE